MYGIAKRLAFEMATMMQAFGRDRCIVPAFLNLCSSYFCILGEESGRFYGVSVHFSVWDVLSYVDGFSPRFFVPVSLSHILSQNKPIVGSVEWERFDTKIRSRVLVGGR